MLAGVIDTISPDFGQEGTRVTIRGSRLLGAGCVAQNVTLSGVDATVVHANATMIVCRASFSSASRGSVVVTSDTFSTVISENTTHAWQYLEPSNITFINPDFGQLNTVVTIQGTSLLGGGTLIVSATLGGVPAVVLFSNNTQVLIQAGSSDADDRSGVLEIQSDTGAVSRASLWTYHPEGNISAVTPNNGQLGTYVTIYGTSLLASAPAVYGVTLAGVQSAIISSNNSMIIVRAGDGTGADIGAGNVTVTAVTGATINALSAFAYVQAGNLTAVTPSSGRHGTRVQLSGTALFQGGSAISRAYVGGVEAVVSPSLTSVFLCLISVFYCCCKTTNSLS